MPGHTERPGEPYSFFLSGGSFPFELPTSLAGRRWPSISRNLVGTGTGSMWLSLLGEDGEFKCAACGLLCAPGLPEHRRMTEIQEWTKDEPF